MRRDLGLTAMVVHGLLVVISAVFWWAVAAPHLPLLTALMWAFLARLVALTLVLAVRSEER